MKWGVMILAAGEATRMGKAKMLLPFKKTTILAHLIEEITLVEPNIIQLVTGYYHDLIQVLHDGISSNKDQQFVLSPSNSPSSKAPVQNELSESEQTPLVQEPKKKPEIVQHANNYLVMISIGTWVIFFAMLWQLSSQLKECKLELARINEQISKPA